MNFKTEYFYCSEKLLKNVYEILEIKDCIKAVKWQADFSIDVNGKSYEHQIGYNKAFNLEFSKYNWELQPVLHSDSPKLIGDYRKNDIFIEVQFGNSATIFRDYYKFHYGLTHNLLSLAVYIVPTKPKDFFPNRPESVNNMAEFDAAVKYFRLLPIPVPILLIGLLPSNSDKL